MESLDSTELEQYIYQAYNNIERTNIMAGTQPSNMSHRVLITDITPETDSTMLLKPSHSTPIPIVESTSDSKRKAVSPLARLND
jgi:hypothetical protein